MNEIKLPPFRWSEYKNKLTNLRWELFTEDKIVERGIWLIGDLLV